MALLSNVFNIDEDERRLCTQNIDGAKPEVLRLLSSEVCNNTIDTNLDFCTRYILLTNNGNINNLCSEIFQLIIAKFLKLNSWRKLLPLRTVCKHWKCNIDSYLASRHGLQYAWSIEKGRPLSGINYLEFAAMLNFFPNLKQLVVKNAILNDSLISLLIRKCPKIEKLSLSGRQNISPKGFTTLVSGFGQLTFIDISHCELDENCLSILVEGLQNLKTMNAINLGSGVTGRCLNKLGSGVKDIWIGLNGLSDTTIALESLVSGHGKNLTHFGLIVDNFQTTNWNIITENMKCLKSLKLTFESYGIGCLRKIGKLKNLEFLVLAEYSRNNDESVLTDESMLHVLQGCKKLKSIALAGLKAETCRFTHNTISLIPKYCVLVEQIRFLNAHNVIDATLIALGQLPLIRVLHLSSMKRITTFGILGFLKLAKNTVCSLRVSNCPYVTDDIIKPIIDIAKMRSKDSIKLFLDGVIIVRSLDNLPPNLKLDIKN